MRWDEVSSLPHHGVITNVLIPMIRYSLAFAELYMMIAFLFRRFELELFETTPENIRVVRDYILPHPEEGTWAVRVKVAGIVEE